MNYLAQRLSVDEFLAEHGGKEFPAVRYRPGASFSTPFGLDNTFGTLRLHPAVDRGRDQAGKYPIYTPFRVERFAFLPDYPSFGTLLVLYTKYGFQVRIAHIERLDPGFAARGGDIPAGTYIGEAGQAGVSQGRHTHTEIVSEDATSPVLDAVLVDKYGYTNMITPYTAADVTKYCRDCKLTGSPEEMYRAEWEKRKLTFLNGYICDRVDYHTGTRRRFYSSQALFGM